MNDIAHIIRYVADQARSTEFYQRVLTIAPRLEMPGMTEFNIGPGIVLGLMPQSSVRRLFGGALPDPAGATGTARAELYLHVDDVGAYHNRSVAAGAKELSPPTVRDWGHLVAYSLDLDSHVVAFASATPVHESKR